MRTKIFQSNLKKRGNGKMRKISLVLALTLVAMLVMATAAFAAHDTFDSKAKNTYDNRTSFQKPGGYTGCDVCHAGTRSVGYTGPHGGYTSTTSKCVTCHTVHSNIDDGAGPVSAAKQLLPGNTVADVCNFCHDLTGANRAPYYTAYMTSESEIGAAHKVEGIKWTFNDGAGVYSETATTLSDRGHIPGGNAADGGSRNYADLFFRPGELTGQKFTCDSCHTPHGIVGTTVNGYRGESARLGRLDSRNSTAPNNRLLKKQLTVGGATYSEYGSQWCAGCHQGRLTMAGDNYNHPVNTAGPGYMTKTMFDANSSTITGGVYYATNAWYAMTAGDPLDNNNARPDGYVAIDNFRSATIGQNGPSCQQCHASARDVDDAGFSFTGDYNARPIMAEGGVNPWAQTFPHVSSNARLLVETKDDLCTNCHGFDNLP